MKIFESQRANFNKVEEERMTTFLKNWNSTTDSLSCNTGWLHDTYADAVPTLVPTIGDTALSVGLQGRCYHHRVPRSSNMTRCRESQDNELYYLFFLIQLLSLMLLVIGRRFCSAHFPCRGNRSQARRPRKCPARAKHYKQKISKLTLLGFWTWWVG